MTTRLLATFASIATSFVLVTGCAAGPEGLDGPDADETDETAETAAPAVEVEMDGVEAQSGLNCACPAGKTFQNGLCYTPCAAGYVGEGPVCWKTCASGFTDTGFFCHRDSKVVSANTSKCPWYNKCGLGSSCSTCPSGYSNDGCTCRRDAYIYAQESYGRGAGTTPTCSSY